jgi:hypothetical protein
MYRFWRWSAVPRSRRTLARSHSQEQLTLETLEERALLSFAPPINTPVGTHPVAVAVSDFNGDGNLDAAVIDQGTSMTAGDLRVLLGNGDGTFQSAGGYRIGVHPVAVAVGDFNGDGIPDIVVANTVSPAGMGGQLAVLLGNGDGTFQLPVFTQLIGTPTALAVTDYNGDGLADVAVTEVGDGRTTGVYVLLGNGDGTFQQGAHFPAPVSGKPTAVAIGDFDGDGTPDIAATFATPNTPTGFVAVWLSSDPNIRPNVYSVGVNPSSIAVGDFNGDGALDLAVANTGSNASRGSVSVLYGNGDGTFQSAANYAAGPDPTAVVVGDFNGDGLPDLAVTNPSPAIAIGGVAVLYNDGEGGFTTPDLYRADLGPTGLAVGDFNNDGFDDLIVTNVDSNDVSVLLQDMASSPATAGGSRVVHTRTSAEATVLPNTSASLAEDEYFRLLAGATTERRDAGAALPAEIILAPRSELVSLNLESLL